MADKKITVRISARDTASRVIKRVGTTARRVGPQIRKHLVEAFRAVRIAVAGLTVVTAGFIKKIISVGSETEQARIQLDAIFGSVEAGAQAFEAVNSAAAAFPFTFADTLKAATMMGTAVRQRGDDLETRLKQIAEVSARYGISMQDAARNFQRFAMAGAASAELFRDAGLNAAMGIQMGMRVSAEESMRLWDKFFANIETEGSSAIGRLANSFAGQVSMMQDALRELAQAISDTGLLTFATNIVKEITRGVRLLAAAARGDLGDAITAAFGYLGARAGEAFLKGLSKIHTALLPEELERSGLGKIFGGFAIDRAIDAAAESTQFWTGRLNELAEAAREAADEVARTTGGMVSGGGGGTGDGTYRGPRIRGLGGLQPTVGGPGIPLSESLQGALPTQLETKHEWRPVLKLDTESVRRETMSSLEMTLDEMFSDLGKVAKQGAFAIGQSVVQGLISGSFSMRDTLKFAMSVIANVLMNGLASSLGIFSPSKVTYGYGQNIVQGMIGGMDSMAAPLAAATNRMAGTVTSGLALPRVGGLSGVVGQPATLTATIKTDDTSSHPPWALDWLAKGNIELRYAGESA